MDLQKIGKFIKEQRKKKNLTQVELADKLGVSEKSVSKWECGNGMPDASLMLPLCKELGISANELLSGKVLSENEYRQQAEQNLCVLKSTQEKNSKLLLSIEFVILYFTLAVFLGLLSVFSFVEMATWLQVVLMVFAFLNLVFGCFICLMIEKEVGFYECKHCHHKYIPTNKQILWSMHMGRTRYMKCPKCQKMSWQKKVLDD